MQLSASSQQLSVFLLCLPMPVLKLETHGSFAMSRTNQTIFRLCLFSIVFCIRLQTYPCCGPISGHFSASLYLRCCAQMGDGGGSGNDFVCSDHYLGHGTVKRRVRGDWSDGTLHSSAKLLELKEHYWDQNWVLALQSLNPVLGLHDKTFGSAQTVEKMRARCTERSLFKLTVRGAKTGVFV